MEKSLPRRLLGSAKGIFIGLMAGVGIFHTATNLLDSYSDHKQKSPDFDQQMADFAKIVLTAQKLSASTNTSATDKMMEGAIEGALKAIDPHSAYLSAERFQQMQTEMHGAYAGVGMSIAPVGQVTVIIAPTEGSPAARAGIKSGDFIYKINGQSVIGKDAAQVSELIKGEEGTPVDVTVVREGIELPVFHLRREVIQTHAVTKTALIGDIGYIRLATFDNEHAAEEMRAAVAKLENDSRGQVRAFLIDERDNPGGLLPEALKISDDFLDGNQTVVSLKSPIPGSEYNRTYVASPGDIAHGKPIAILLNRGSASASEIFAAALQDNGRAEIIGETSFGKGSGQSVIPLSKVFKDASRKDAILITSFLHHRPQGATIQDHGVVPNLTFVADPNAKKVWRPAEAEMPGALANPNEIAPPKVRNDGTCAAVDVNLSGTGLDKNLLGRDGKPDFQLMCGVEFLQKASGQVPAGHIRIDAPQKLTSIKQAVPVIQ